MGADSACPIDRRQHQPAATLRGHRAVEEMEGVGHHPRGQDVLHAERTPTGVHGCGILVPVVPDRRRDDGELFGRGAMAKHVAPGDQGELGGGEQAVTDHELVRGPGPRSGLGPVRVEAGAARRHHDDRALSGRDEGSCVEQHRDAQAPRSSRAGSEPQPENELLREFAHGPVDLAGVDAGIGEGTQRAFQGDGAGIVSR